MEKAASVTDPKNEKILKQIVLSNANEWCRTRMVHTSISQEIYGKVMLAFSIEAIATG
jgi:hypothetical protein